MHYDFIATLTPPCPMLRGLKPGDSVTLKFTTDFERHRILVLRKNADSAK